MKTTKQTCSECGKKRERCKPAVQLLDGAIDYVCPQCWKAFNYAFYMTPKDVQPGPR